MGLFRGPAHIRIQGVPLRFLTILEKPWVLLLKCGPGELAIFSHPAVSVGGSDLLAEHDGQDVFAINFAIKPRFKANSATLTHLH